MSNILYFIRHLFSDYHTYILEVSNMNSGTCLSTVKDSLHNLQGVEVICISLVTNKIVVISNRSVNDICSVISHSGFRVSLI